MFFGKSINRISYFIIYFIDPFKYHFDFFKHRLILSILVMNLYMADPG